MEYLLIAIVLVTVFAFIANPVLRPPDEETSEPDALAALITQRDSAYQAIRDLDFDFQLGKISDSEYQPLRERYKAHAAAVLQQIDTLQPAPNTPNAPLSTMDKFCGICGTPREPDDKFCRKCGAKLN